MLGLVVNSRASKIRASKFLPARSRATVRLIMQNKAERPPASNPIPGAHRFDEPNNKNTVEIHLAPFQDKQTYPPRGEGSGIVSLSERRRVRRCSAGERRIDRRFGVWPKARRIGSTWSRPGRTRISGGGLRRGKARRVLLWGTGLTFSPRGCGTRSGAGSR